MAKYGVLLCQYSEVHCKVIPIINKCLDEMKSSSRLVNGPKVETSNSFKYSKKVMITSSN